jgi:protein-S-isoprenylcysteine O-methyltransferase Ste14
MLPAWLIAAATLLIATQEAAYARNGRGVAAPPGDRSQPLLIATFLLAMAAALAAAVGDWGVRAAWQLPGAGIGVFLAGWTLRMTAIRQLGRYFTAHVTVVVDQPVIDRGVYRHVRHPGYLGVLLEVAGCALTTGSGAAWVALMVGYLPALVYRIRVEEDLLVGRLGEAYSRYQARTWRLLPFCF